jgi:Uma2 family endonuclease
MSWPQTHHVFTPEEYLALERPSEIRHEFLDGTVYAMAGETPEHSLICFNLGGIMHAQLKDKPCRGFSPNMKVRTDPSGLFAYPDLTVVCGEPRYHDNHRDVLTNPTVIFEVLSRSTAAYDRGEKSLRYRTHISSLKDFILVAQDKPHAEHYSRQQDRTWAHTEISGLDALLILDSIDCQLSLAELYAGIVFPESAAS